MDEVYLIPCRTPHGRLLLAPEPEREPGSPGACLCGRRGSDERGVGAGGAWHKSFRGEEPRQGRLGIPEET
ncbi:MAG: hypothetical protein ACREXX_17635, partial [Gammaproteobacteria bacterium]